MCSSPIRATNCSRSTRRRSSPSRSPSSLSASGRACASSPGGTSSTASSRSSSSCRATATTAKCADADRRLSGRGLRRARLGLLPGLSGRLARPRPFHRRPRRRADARIRARRRSRQRSRQSYARGATASRPPSGHATTPPVPSSLGKRYGAAFPPAYRDDFPPETAVADIDGFERLTSERPIAGEFRTIEDGGQIGLRLIHLNDPIALSARVPMLENMGFRVIDERTYAIAPAEERLRIWLHDMTLDPRPRCSTSPASAPPPRLLHGGLVRPRRGRRLQCADGHRRPRLARYRASPHRLALPPPGRRHLLAALYVVDAHRPSGSRGAPGRALSRALRPGARRRLGRGMAGKDRRRASTPCESLDEDRIIRRFVNVICGHRAHQLLPARQGRRAAPGNRDQARLPRHRRPAARHDRSAKSSCTARASTASISASARSRAAASAGPTGRRISAPRSSASPRRSRSRTR